MTDFLARKIMRWWRISFKFDADNTNKNMINSIRDSIMINPLRLLPISVDNSWLSWNCKKSAEKQARQIGLLVVNLGHAADWLMSYCCFLFDGWDEETGGFD